MSVMAMITGGHILQTCQRDVDVAEAQRHFLHRDNDVIRIYDSTTEYVVIQISASTGTG